MTPDVHSDVCIGTTLVMNVGQSPTCTSSTSAGAFGKKLRTSQHWMRYAKKCLQRSALQVVSAPFFNSPLEGKSMTFDSHSAKKWLFPLMLTSLLIGGCAAPIKSRPYVSGESYEGLRYHLSKTTVTVTFAAQLKSCSEGALKNQPSILLLTPTVGTKISADPASSYVINPADSVNWFRKIEVPNLKLSADGRLSEAEAKSVDSTPAVLLSLAQAAFASRKAFARSASAPPAPTLDTLRSKRDTWPQLFEAAGAPSVATRPITPAATCTDEAESLLKEFNEARLAYEALRKLPRTLTKATDFDRYSDVRFKAIQDEEQRLLTQLIDLNNKLTARTELTLADESKDPVDAVLDLAEKWVVETNHYGCDTLAAVAERKKALSARTPAEKKKAAADFDALLATQPLCVQISGNLSKGSLLSSARPNNSSATSDVYPGLMFRVPANAGVTAIATGRAVSNQPTLIANFAAKANARPVTNGWEWAPDVPLSFAIQVADSRPVLQFGAIAKMPSDVGVLTSNGIHTTFDANGVPASVNWTVDPLPVAAFLGLPAQIYGLRPLPAVGPSATSLLQGSVLDRLLQSCLDALAAGVAVPAYCASIINSP